MFNQFSFFPPSFPMNPWANIYLFRVSTMDAIAIDADQVRF